MDSPNQLTYVQLPDSETVKALNEYKTLLLRLMKKGIVSVTTIGGHTSYLSDSSLEALLLKNEICSIINSTVIKLPYYNAYTGIIVSSLLTNLWSDPSYEHGVENMTKSLLKFKMVLDDALNSLKYKSNLTDVVSLQKFLENVLLQEPAFLLSKESLNKLTTVVVKSVLAQSSNESGFKLGRIVVHVKEGSDCVLMVNGIIFEVNDLTGSLIEKNKPTLDACNKMLLFTESIEDSNNFLSIIKILVDNKIKLILCQKQISDLLKLTLRRNNIVAIERIGIQAAKDIALATGCIPICDVNQLEIKDVLTTAGFYSTYRLLTLNKLNYIVIERTDQVSTLYLSCRSFSDVSYVKKMCSKSIRLACSMINSSYLLPGPIAFEENLIAYLKNKRSDDKIMINLISIFCNVFNEISFVSKDLIDTNHPTTGDLYHLKRNALMYSIDLAINILSIGIIVRKQY